MHSFFDTLKTHPEIEIYISDLLYKEGVELKHGIWMLEQLGENVGFQFLVNP